MTHDSQWQWLNDLQSSRFIHHHEPSSSIQFTIRKNVNSQHSNTQQTTNWQSLQRQCGCQKRLLSIEGELFSTGSRRVLNLQQRNRNSSVADSWSASGTLTWLSDVSFPSIIKMLSLISMFSGAVSGSWNTGLRIRFSRIVDLTCFKTMEQELEFDMWFPAPTKPDSIKTTLPFPAFFLTRWSSGSGGRPRPLPRPLPRPPRPLARPPADSAPATASISASFVGHVAGKSSSPSVSGIAEAILQK